MNKKIDTSRYVLTDPAQVGEDVDLDTEVYTGADGERITEASTEEYTTKRAAEARKGGRPSLGGKSGPSPQVAFRISAELREQADKIAEREGRKISEIAREQLERYVQSHRDAA